MKSEKLSKPRVDIVILAAGESKRLGTPKQLVELDSGQSLLQHTVDAALESRAESVYVVVGYREDEIAESIPDDRRLKFIQNPNWEEGMGSSVRKAYPFLISRDLTGAIFSVCDQPRISSLVFDCLISAHSAERSLVVASRYASRTLGVPVLLPSVEFGQLKKCRGDQGLRSFLNSQASVSEIGFPGGEFDVDAPEDLTRNSYRAAPSKSRS